MATHLHDHLDRFHARLRDGRLAMFGLNRLPRVYEAAFGWLGDPLYRRVATDVASAGLAGGDAVVDVGTGPGRVPDYLHQLRPDLSIEGIDISPEMIELARARTAVAETGCGSLRYTVADVAQLPLADASVALVVSSLSLHHCPDPAAGLAEIMRVLRPGGRAWIYDANAPLEAAKELLNAAGVASTMEALAPHPGRRGRMRDRLITGWVSRLVVDSSAGDAVQPR